MISSKKFNLIAVFLTLSALIFVICAMFFHKKTDSEQSVGTLTYSERHKVDITSDDYYTTYSQTSLSKINLKGTSATSNSKNVVLDGNNITIQGGGIYVVSGTLDGGCITVDSKDSTEVRLVLNGVNITSNDFSAIYVKQSEKTVISLVPETENFLTDAATYNEEKLEDGKPTAAVYSKDDLVINGSGHLTINGNYSDGIKANDILKITEANLNITSTDDGINANDCIVAINSTINVVSGGDSIKCEETSIEKGFIAFERSSLILKSESDGISASSSIYMNDTDAEITTSSGGKTSSTTKTYTSRFNSQSFDDAASAKGIKAVLNIDICGGKFTLDTLDDSIHSDGDLTVEKGIYSISSGDDAVHAEMNLVLSPETMTISKSYEGLEGSYITINGGDIKIISSDDGINASGENSSGGMGMMFGYQGEEKASEEDIWLTVNGGHVYIETSGDGFDSNGSAVLNGGYLEIYGPENSGNGSIDVGDGGYVLLINGGSLLAAGSSGMAEHPSESSSQQSLSFFLEENYSAGNTITIKDSNGNTIISGTPTKRFNWVCVSTETLVQAETYTLYINDSEASSVVANGAFAQSGSQFRGGMMNGPTRRQK